MKLSPLVTLFNPLMILYSQVEHKKDFFFFFSIREVCVELLTLGWSHLGVLTLILLGTVHK